MNDDDTESAPGPLARIAAVGMASWDRLLVVDRYPKPGEYVVVRAELSAPGGTTTNSAVALARLGAEVRIAALVGDDEYGAALRAGLEAEKVDTDWLVTRVGQRTDASTIVVSHDPPERTIYWHRGAHLVRGDRLDIPALFGHDVVLLDVADVPLRRFLLDLPAHTLPRTRLLGPLTFLADPALPDALDLVLRHDVVVGNERELLAVTGTWAIADAITALQSRMPGANLRACVVTRGAYGCRIFTKDERWQVPAFRVDATDTTGAGDAFAAGVAYGLARRWPWPELGRFANAVGALATRALGARASLPTIDEVATLTESGSDRSASTTS